MNPARQQQNQAEMDRIADDILGVDRQFDALGLGLPGVQYKAGKMVLTREGVEGMLSRFLAGEIKGTKFATAEQIRDGMVNAFNMAKAIVDENPDAEVVMVNSREAWNREIGSPTKISRGVHVSEDAGKIVLYAPALKANTAYHEGFHQMVYRALDDGDGSALIKLASAVRRGMPRQMLEYYGRFLNQETYQNKSEAEVAEEFLAEVYSDLTMGAIQVEYQKGIISGFVKFLNDALASKGINIKASPTVVDLMWQSRCCCSHGAWRRRWW